jgi:tetratricopeptide (TPR) repeat protein
MQQPELAERLLGSAREVAGDVGTEAEARCDLLEARLRLHHGDVGEVRRALARCTERGVTNPGVALEVQVLSASADLFEGRLDDAERSFERALEQAREQGNLGIEARSLNGLSATHHLQGAFTESLEDARAAAAAAERSGDPIAEGRARSNAGLLAAEYGDLNLARVELESAQRTLEQHGDLRHAATAAQNLAAVLRELGDLENATRAALMAQRSGGRRLVGFALAELGYIAHERGDVTRAKSYYDRALDAHRAAGNRYFVARMLPFRAATLAALGRAEDAEAAFSEAERYFAEVGDRMGAALSSLLRGHADLSLARGAAAANEPVEPHLTAARQRLEQPAFGTSPELRLARALLERDLAHASSPDAHRLRIAGDGAWFALASVRQNLRTRQALKRLLLSLAGAHFAGRKLSVDELFQAGWPGERVRRESAARRVYVAIATLRKLGLRDHIERHSEGYALVGAVEIDAAQ